MKMIFTTLVFLIAGMCAASEPTLVYLVRHAEKVDDSRDADLSPKGLERANALKSFFEKIQIDAVYASQYIRTQKTVKPVADARGLAVNVVDAGKPNELVSKVMASAGKTILIAGHSNTTPKLIELLGGPVVEIPDDVYQNLFLLILQDGHCVFQQFQFQP